jgi:hypothetical protein
MATPEDVYRLFRDFKDLSKQEQLAAQNHDLGRLRSVLDQKEGILADLQQDASASTVVNPFKKMMPSVLQSVHAQLLLHPGRLAQTQYLLKHQLKKIYKMKASAPDASKPRAHDTRSHLDTQA